MQRSLKDYLTITLKGMAMGAADVVPGVSGGTIAFITGIYQELIATISGINFGLIKIWKDQGFASMWKEANGSFIVALLSGILVSIFTVMRLTNYLLEAHPIMIWSFFFGLILASIWFVAKQIPKWNFKIILALLIGAAVALYIVTLPPMGANNSLWFLFLAGSIAVCAMILPGISGAFILVLLGSYKTITEAAHDFDLKTLGVVALGAIVGLLTFSRVLKWLFDHYSSITLAVLTGLFTQLAKIYPDNFEMRLDLLRNKSVKAGQWGLTDEHTIPIYNIETKKLVKRQVIASDVFTLFEWADHMLSVSNNGAASIVWREVLLMEAFGNKYPALTQEEADKYFKETNRKLLTDLGNDVVNLPLRDLGISKDEWRLGTFFTRGANTYVGAKDGSIGTPIGLMKFLIKLEQGNIVDTQSSLEMKRLMYMTDRRIRYAQSPALKEAAVYFKSGSLYKCDRSKGEACGKYMGNVQNFMNSVVIVEQPDNCKYMVALMSNVLRKNSGTDHMYLASQVDKIIKK